MSKNVHTTEDSLHYALPKLKYLPVREQLAYRVSTDSNGLNLIELLAMLIGGSNQIGAKERLTARFGTIQKFSRSHTALGVRSIVQIFNQGESRCPVL